jgi:SAM-dependent methyltransferase
MPGFYATIARYYDSEHADKEEDIPFYSEIAASVDGPVLIIGSGTGRLALALAQQGRTVHGIEIEPAMLERARRKLAARPALGERLTFQAGDALTARLEARFALVIVPYNTFMHFLTQEAQLALLGRLRGWLRPDGLIVLDLPNAGEAFASQDLDAVILERTFLEQETGHLVMQQSVSQLDRVEQEMTITWIYDEINEDGMVQRTVVPTTVHYFFRSEITLLLQAAGLKVEDVLGDFDGSPFGDGAPRMIVVAG